MVHHLFPFAGRLIVTVDKVFLIRFYTQKMTLPIGGQGHFVCVKTKIMFIRIPIILVFWFLDHICILQNTVK